MGYVESIADDLSDLRRDVTSLSAIIGKLIIGRQVKYSTEYYQGDISGPGTGQVQSVDEQGELTIQNAHEHVTRFVKDVTLL